MKTIKQIAEEIGVSKQAIFYKMNKPPLSETLKPFMDKFDGVLTVFPNGEKLIKQAFNKTSATTIDTDVYSDVYTHFDGREIIAEPLHGLTGAINELTSAIKRQAENESENENFPVRQKGYWNRRATSIPMARLLKKESKLLQTRQVFSTGIIADDKDRSQIF
jgi:hypothetical protein